jgi:hypothetical protein
VVLADNWVLPFRPELIDWPTQCAVIIPEDDVNRTIDILTNISAKEECQRRQRCYDIYQKYMATPLGTVNGVIDGLELARKSDPWYSYKQ